MYQLGLYEKAMPSDLSWNEKLILVRECNFDYLEISIDETDEKLARLDNKEEMKEIKSAIEHTGVPVNSMCLSGHRRFPLGSHDTEIAERSLEIMSKAVDLASYLGVRIIQLAGYDVYYEESDDGTKKRFLMGLQKAVELAAEKGIILGFETMETPFMDTVEKAMTYVKRINNPFLGIYPDIGNLKNSSLLYKHSVVLDLKKGSGHIWAAHLKETIPGHYREIPFGTGHTEYKECIHELWSQGVRMYVGEFWYKGSVQWKEDLLNAAVFLREKIEDTIKSYTK